MPDNRKVSVVTVDELIKAFWAGKPAIQSPIGPGIERVVYDGEVVQPPPPERPGIDYHTASDIYFGMTRQERQLWTGRSDEELLSIMKAEAKVPDEKKLRFYRGGVEWQPF